MASFDIVSTFDMQELDNAVNMVKRDILNRYDFKGSNSSISLNKQDKNIKIETGSSMQRQAIQDMLIKRSISRSVPIKIFNFKQEEQAAGMTVRQFVELKEGVSKENSKIINKLIKSYNLKVQSQIQGEQIRITAKKIDDLQDVISRIKEEKITIPLQYINFKK